MGGSRGQNGGQKRGTQYHGSGLFSVGIDFESTQELDWAPFFAGDQPREGIRKLSTARLIGIPGPRWSWRGRSTPV